MAKKKGSKKKHQERSLKMSPETEAEQMKEIEKQKIETIKELFLEAESALDSFLHELAVEHCKRILSLDSENTEAMEMLAGIYTELGSVDEAKTLCLRCVEIAPNNGHKKYFTLAQISESQEALNFYQKGISLLQKQLEEAENTHPEKNSSPDVLKMTLSDGYCAVAELYMTDLCDEENAHDSCRVAIDKSISVEPKNPDSYRILTAFSIIEENIEEAKLAIQQNLSFWFEKYEAMRDNPDADIDTEIPVPEYMTRIEISKLLIELEMFEEASKILEGLLEEDDEVFIAWYLLGWLNYNQGDVYYRNAYYYFKKAKKVARKTGEDDSDQANHIDELFVILTEKGIKSEDEEDDGEEDDAAIHSASSDDEEECMES